MSQQIFYKDLPLDIRVTSNGDINEVVNSDSIKQSLRMITDTARGSRIFFPEFGSRIKAFLFEPFDESTGRRMAEEIQTTIVNYEKRIKILNINVDMDFVETMYELNVTYQVVTTGEVDNLSVALEKL